MSHWETCSFCDARSTYFYAHNEVPFIVFGRCDVHKMETLDTFKITELTREEIIVREVHQR